MLPAPINSFTPFKFIRDDHGFFNLAASFRHIQSTRERYSSITGVLISYHHLGGFGNIGPRKAPPAERSLYIAKGRLAGWLMGALGSADLLYVQMMAPSGWRLENRFRLAHKLDERVGKSDGYQLFQ